MSKNLLHIFNKTDHIDESKLWLYSKGKLHRDEAHEVEKHLVDCEMCSDIVEGFSKFSSEGNFNAAMNRVSEAFFNAARRKRKLIIRQLSIAAGFVLIAASGIFLITQLRQTKSPEFQLSKEITPENKRESEIIYQKDDSIENIAKLEETPLNPQEKSQEPISLVESTNTNEDKNKQNIVSENNEEEFMLMDELKVVENNDESMLEESPEVEYAFDQDEESVIKSETITSGTTSLNKLAEQDASFSGAVMDSEVVSQESRNRSLNTPAVGQDKNATEVNPFKNGMSAYYNKNYEYAIQILQEIPRKSSDYWDARWTIADSYIKMGKTDTAKAEYIKIRDKENPYQYAAGEKLHELE
ncbi:MAG: tetratricopeptide repeat protein [Bacteroidota bacterium]|nr:tetratricopeptide repeat protein [Bacteroidota bacterium]